jgi:glucuronoarabinoxylan endo-1,4-beta-xylanase
MNRNSLAKASSLSGIILVSLIILSAAVPARTQLVYVVDQFDPSGVDGNSYVGGQIGNVWGNWFGSAFSNLVWDSISDVSNNPASGSMKVTVNFNGQGSIPNQFEVYDGFNGITPALNGLQYTNFQCDVRFAQGSATTGGTFGYLQFGIAVGYNQDYFGSISVPSSNTNWVHVSINLDAISDTNLQNIYDVLIHIYGPAMSGVSTFWVDNIKFAGASPVTTNCVVDWNNVHQSIDGFGASSAWDGSWTTNQADILFSTNLGVVYSDNLGNKYTNNGVGLSLLRNRIAPASSALASATPTTVEVQIMQWAQVRGARIWSTPWTPPAGFKSTNDIYDTGHAGGSGLYGGSFLGGNATNQAYASQLANYVASMTSQGINLYAISIQNEPDASVTTYEACQWTNTLIHDFVTNLYNALVAKGVGSTKIMLPESQNWQDYQNLAGPAMTDPNVAADVGIIADHNYDGANGPVTLTKNSYGKALWETEVSQLNGESSGIANGVYYAERIFLFMTVAQANAWHYWWLVATPGSTTGLMDGNAAPTKRLFTVGNYSRFVRPGYYRIDVSNDNPITSISAYKDTNSGNFAIVAVNPDPVTVTQIFNLANFTASSVTPWITSSNLSLASQSAVNVTNASFTYALPAMSVVTFVGQDEVASTNITISSASYIPGGSSFVLTWNATAGATYSVLKTNVLEGSATNWPAIVTGYLEGGAAGGPLSYTDTTATVSPAFYRVSSP